MEKVIFVGNGFNLISDMGASWDALLNKLAGTPENKHEEELRKAKPFTLWFEELSSKTDVKAQKRIIAESLGNDLRQNKYHADVMALNVRHILTTNYDYNLENASGTSWNSDNSAKETYYSLFRRNKVANKHVWHIHGELNSISSIILGHGQYSGYIHKIRNYLTIGVPTKNKAHSGKPYLSKFSPLSKAYKGNIETWVDIFLASEVHLVGFSFDYTENHLWKLLTEKRKLQREKLKVGKMVFHYCSINKPNITDEARISILGALGVEIRNHITPTYSASYDACIQSIRRP